MEQAIGLSHLYPALPIMNFFAMIMLPLLIHGFWKTRIVALIALYSWLFLENLLTFIGMIYWRGHASDAPVLASILSVLWRADTCGFYTSAACFAHFIWQRLHPLPVRELYDTVSVTVSCMSLESDAECSLEKEEQLDPFFLYSNPSSAMVPLNLVSCPFRYRIMEDFGPAQHTREDWPGFLIFGLPRLLGCWTIVIFTILSLINYWRMKREGINSAVLKYHSSVRTRKLVLMAVIHMLLAMYGICMKTVGIMTFKWVPPTSLDENIASLQIVLMWTRSEMDVFKDYAGSTTRGAIIMPSLAFYHFAWFGLGEEARKPYVEALLKLGRLINATPRAHWPHVRPLAFSWSAIAPLRNQFRQGLANALSLVLPIAPQITPYTSSVPPDGTPEPLTSPIRIQPPNPVGNRVDIKRQERVPSREPTRRLSIHKPSLTALNPVNAIPSPSGVPLRRLSHHKPSFVPLAPLNAHVIATPDASGSSPRERAANDIRRQEKFTTHPLPRRLSYHKPAFVPLAPANVHSAAPNALGPTIPLAAIPRDRIGERDAVLQAEEVVEDTVAPPLLSSVSTPTAPPPFSTPSTATPAPPYQDVNPFLSYIPQCTHE